MLREMGKTGDSYKFIHIFWSLPSKTKSAMPSVRREARGKKKVYRRGVEMDRYGEK
jgi:hypothetical protein